MNLSIIMGRVVREPEIKYANEGMCIAKYTLAVDRKKREDGADFINCTAFGKSGEFAEKYFHKGTKVLVTGHIQTGSYTNKDGVKVYTTEVVVDNQEFAESKSSNTQTSDDNGFMNVTADEDLPFAAPQR